MDIIYTVRIKYYKQTNKALEGAIATQEEAIATIYKVILLYKQQQLNEMTVKSQAGSKGTQQIFRVYKKLRVKCQNNG